MRRLMLLMLGLSFLGALSGCKHVFTHGVCDCELEDPCASRAPWVRYSPMTPPVETIPPPAKEMPAAPKGT